MGFNKDIDQGVHFLTDENRSEIFYTASHTGVIFDYIQKEQKLLQGHCNLITATACSENKRWIVTADSGEDSMLVVWDSLSATPVRTFQNPHPNGVRAMDLSVDNQYIVTLGMDTPQTISLWDWTDESQQGPIVSAIIKSADPKFENFWIKFNPDDPHELIANSRERVVIFNWTEGNSKFDFYSPRVEKRDYSVADKQNCDLTKSVFIPTTEMAVTATKGGDILVWDKSLILEGVGEANEKRLIKVVTLNAVKDSKGPYIAITMLTTVHDQYLVVGNADGSIRFYDFKFKVVAWFEDMNLHIIKSISFSKRQRRVAVAPVVDLTEATDKNKKDEVKAMVHEQFSCADFIVADSSSYVVELQSQIFEAVEANKKKGISRLFGIRSSISAIAVSPKNPYLAVAGSDGWIVIWDYERRVNICQQFVQYKKETRDKGKVGEKDNKNTKYSGDPKRRYDKVNKLFTCIEFSQDGSELIVG